MVHEDVVKGLISCSKSVLCVQIHRKTELEKYNLIWSIRTRVQVETNHGVL